MTGLLPALALHSLRMSIPALLLLGAAPRLLKRFSARWVYLTWIIVLTAFLLPVSLPVDTPLQIGLPHGDTEMIGFTAGDAQPDTAGQTVAAAHGGQQRARSFPGIPYILWAVGVVAAGCYHGIRLAAYIKALNLWKQPVTESWLTELLERGKMELGIRRSIVLYRCAHVVSPVLTGLFRPAILLPEGQYSEIELRYVLKHELMHYKQGDPWIKLMALAVLCMHWFNPVTSSFNAVVSISISLFISDVCAVYAFGNSLPHYFFL